MTKLPNPGIPPEERQRRTNALYLLMGRQVKGYHKARHMGENTSVPVELARELLTSMLYTLDQAGGIEGNPDPALGLEKGRAVLQEKLRYAKQRLQLVEASAPSWQGECRWDVMQCLTRFLRAYDLYYLAHMGPDAMFYPLPMPMPENLAGVDQALHMLRILWAENQIMDAFPQTDLEPFWFSFCRDDRTLTENQCMQLLLNAAGKILLYDSASGALFTGKERQRLQDKLSGLSKEELKKLLESASNRLAACLGLTDAAAVCCTEQAVLCQLPRLWAAVRAGDLSPIFL